MTADPDWASLADGIRTHWDEILAEHEGRPTVAEQNVNNGAPAPEVDRGGQDGC